MLKIFDNDELLLWKWQIIQNLKWKFKCNVVCSWKCDQMLKSKVAQFFQKLPKRQSQQKCVFFKISLQKVSKYLGYFCKKMSQRTFKITHSGRTDFWKEKRKRWAIKILHEIEKWADFCIFYSLRNSQETVMKSVFEAYFLGIYFTATYSLWS